MSKYCSKSQIRKSYRIDARPAVSLADIVANHCLKSKSVQVTAAPKRSA